MTKFYAYTDILDAKGGTAKIGSEVTPDSLGVDEDGFRQLFNNGSIRREPYPEDIRHNESVRNYKLRKIREAQEEVDTPSFLQRLTGKLSFDDTEDTANESHTESTEAKEVPSLTERLGLSS